MYLTQFQSIEGYLKNARHHWLSRPNIFFWTIQSAQFSPHPTVVTLSTGHPLSQSEARIGPNWPIRSHQVTPWHHLNRVKVTLCTFRKPQRRKLSLIHWKYDQHLISCQRTNVLISLEKYQFHPELLLRRCEVWWQEWRLSSGLWLVNSPHLASDWLGGGWQGFPDSWIIWLEIGRGAELISCICGNLERQQGILWHLAWETIHQPLVVTSLIKHRQKSCLTIYNS